MANVENTTSWKQIQQGVRETERLIGHKEFNLAMVKARQTLEYRVRCMAEKACLVEGDLSDTIDQLYEGRWISRNTKDHYHNIRILGNKAVHEGDDTAYDANQAYQMLVQEVKAFADEYSSGRPAARPSGSGARGSQGRSSSGNRRPAQQQGRRPSGSGGNRRKKRKRVSPAYYVLRFLVPLLAVILLIVVIRALLPDKEDKVKETTAPVTVEAPTEPPTQEQVPEPTEPTTQAEETGGVYVITGSAVNVRKEPSKDARILAQLTKGATVDYVKRYSNEWAVINYDGQEAYVASQYLEKQVPATEGENTPATSPAAQ